MQVQMVTSEESVSAIGVYVYMCVWCINDDHCIKMAYGKDSHFG